jgi:hypothetical protein
MSVSGAEALRCDADFVRAAVSRCIEYTIVKDRSMAALAAGFYQLHVREIA